MLPLFSHPEQLRVLLAVVSKDYQIAIIFLANNIYLDTEIAVYCPICYYTTTKTAIDEVIVTSRRDFLLKNY